MGRVSRRNQIAELNETGVISAKTNIRVYKTAVYARLSVEDMKNDENGESISTQVFFIKKHIEDNPEFSVVNTFTDNGYTGTNFQRPGFERLMEEVRAGRIDCVIVKDLSRLGRNYIEAGTYIENIFPFLGVRFIAINDNYDSSMPMDNNKYFSVSIKNLSNEFVARDVSRKVHSVFKAKQRNGEFIGSYAAHGYMKNPEDKHKLVIDPETAPVILRIFQMRDEGLSYRKIADTLNAEGIESPAAYKIRKGWMVQNHNRQNSIWEYTRISTILKNPVYIGHLAQGKFSHSKLDGGKTICHSRDEWIVVENTHEPIIPMDLWERVQKKFEETQRYYDENFGKYAKKSKYSENIFKGKIFCGDCGYAVSRYSKYYDSGERYYMYYCSHKDADGKFCPSKFILETELFNAVYKIIRLQMDLCMDYKKIIAGLETQKGVSQYADALNAEWKKLVSKRNCLANKKALLYNDYADKIISREDYITLIAGYDAEYEELTQQINRIEKNISDREVMLSADNDWIVAFDKFRRQRKLSKEMVDALVKKVIIKSKTDIEIEFYYQDEFEKLVNGLSKLREEVNNHA